MKEVNEMVNKILVDNIPLIPREVCVEFEFGLISPLHDLKDINACWNLIIVANDDVVFKSYESLKKPDYVVYLNEDGFSTDVIGSGKFARITNLLLNRIISSVNERIQKHLISEFNRHKIDDPILLCDKWDVFRDKNLTYLFDEIKWIPKQLLKQLESYPVLQINLCSEQDYFYKPYERHIHESNLISKVVEMYSTDTEIDSENGFNSLMYLYAKKEDALICNIDLLSSEHWLHKYCKHISEDTVKVIPLNQKVHEGKIVFNHTPMSCDYYILSAYDLKVVCVEPAVLTIDDEKIVTYPKNTMNDYRVLKQLTDTSNNFSKSISDIMESKYNEEINEIFG